MRSFPYCPRGSSGPLAGSIPPTLSAHRTSGNQPGRQPDRWHRRRLLRHPGQFPDREQGDDEQVRRNAVHALGNSCRQVFICAVSYQPDRPSSDDVLRQELLSTLEEFSLTGTQI